MNIKKFMAGAVASVMAVSAMAVVASAYDGKMMYADSSWAVSDMDDENLTTITGDGTYTVTSNFPAWVDDETGDETPAVSGDALVFCVDIVGLSTDTNSGKGADGYDDCKTGADKMAFAKAAGIEVSDVKVSATKEDGSTVNVTVDQSKVIYGDIEGNGNIRVEIYNEYGDTKNDAPITPADLSGATEVSVTFTIKGIDAPSEPASGDGENPPAPGDGNNPPAPGGTDGAGTDPNKDKPAVDTGIEGVAVVAGLAIVAAGAVVVAKKRK